MSGYWAAPDDYDYSPSISSGSAHSVSSDEPESDRVEDLRRTVEEITGKPVTRPSRKLGFY